MHQTLSPLSILIILLLSFISGATIAAILLYALVIFVRHLFRIGK